MLLFMLLARSRLPLLVLSTNYLPFYATPTKGIFKYCFRLGFIVMSWYALLAPGMLTSISAISLLAFPGSTLLGLQNADPG